MSSATTSGDIHPRLIEALSPPSHFYFTLWPLIIAKSPFVFRYRTLRNVNHEFRKFADSLEDSRSIRAKSNYMIDRATGHDRELPPLALEGLPFDSVIEWREWGADKAGFNDVKAFRDFCAIGDIDPDAVVKYDPYASDHEGLSQEGISLPQSVIDCYTQHMWSSRAKDILVFSLNNPLKTNGYCHYFGILGRADKLAQMFDFFREKGWCAKMGWEREWT
ncbi:hypothetical protein BS47DRAFT_1349976 [Hydnum rufescens UP504]|uniref:Uncharacterized protein n=1 Tax=Hydnum rufescens UP504 TaxID=1448309 RepID=A0A9P6ANJ5_9AGAM|nr:hypothetical protein BS47DRAFT_1349976 [Hydnum rufescens UP504]